MLNELADQIHKNAREKGFYDKDRNIGEMLALIHSEVSEALEADRAACKLCRLDPVQMGYIFNCNSSPFIEKYNSLVKGSFGEEMADIIIRVLDLCAYKNINIENHIKAKMRYNSLREYKHGKKY